jgi:hypothetical protein
LRVAISGASGLIGTALRPELTARGDDWAALVRRTAGKNEIQWDPAQPLDPAKLNGFDALVHLSGKNIAGRWTAKLKREAFESRVQSTSTLARAAAESFRQSGRPSIFVSASAIGYYGNRDDELLTEESPAGSGFAPQLAEAWEAASLPASEAGLRVVNLRIGIVLASHGGALRLMLPVFRMGIGGRTGTGRQYMSWITLDDVAAVIVFALRNDAVRGPVNLVSPEPVRNSEFVQALGNELHRPTLLPFPAFAVRLLFGEMGEQFLLGSQRVEPRKLTAAGYRFRHPTLREALRAVIA